MQRFVSTQTGGAACACAAHGSSSQTNSTGLCHCQNACANSRGVSLCELAARAWLPLLVNAVWPVAAALEGRWRGADMRRARCSSCTTALNALCVMLRALTLAAEEGGREGKGLEGSDLVGGSLGIISLHTLRKIQRPP